MKVASNGIRHQAQTLWNSVERCICIFPMRELHKPANRMRLVLSKDPWSPVSMPRCGAPGQAWGISVGWLIPK